MVTKLKENNHLFSLNDELFQLIFKLFELQVCHKQDADHGILNGICDLIIDNIGKTIYANTVCIFCVNYVKYLNDFFYNLAFLVFKLAGC
jgi:hypothetical protein